jgi:hypothetical protein
MTLTDFLLARIAEDEQRIRLDVEALESFTIDPHQMLADYGAKRLIVELHGSQVTPEGESYWSPEIRALAAVYADHPDYRSEWRP